MNPELARRVAKLALERCEVCDRECREWMISTLGLVVDVRLGPRSTARRAAVVSLAV
jgi:hypothetical protein